MGLIMLDATALPFEVSSRIWQPASVIDARTVTLNGEL
jgi:hypothetical protein